MMCHKKIFVVITLSLVFYLLILNYVECGVGSTGWIIFRKVQSPKPKPITTVCAVRGDLSGVLYNPSILSTVERNEIFFISEFGFTEDKLAGIIFAYPFKRQTISAGVLNYDAGETTLYWIESGKENKKTVKLQNDLLGMISYSRAITDKLKAGLTAKFATSSIVEAVTAQAYAVDLGISYFVTDRLIFSVAAQNFGMTTKFFDKSEKLPSSLWSAVGYTASFGNDYYYSLGIDVPYILDERRVTPSVGVEVGRIPFGIFFGYRYADESKFNIGLSLALKDIDVSYAFAPSTWLNHVHRISLGVRF